MINLAISLGLLILVAGGMMFGGVHWALSLPLGLGTGLAAFIFLGRKVQEALEALLTQMQKEVQAGKIDRAIETLKRGFSFKHRHIFVASQLNSQIGMLYYLKKDHDTAFAYLKKGFMKHYVGACMLAIIYYKRKDIAMMKKTMENTIQANKKEAMCRGLYAYLLYQLKEREEAIEVLQKGLKKLPDDQRLSSNLTQLQNNKKMKMKVFGDIWVQFMLERPPRIMQAPPQHMRMKRKAMFR